LTTARVVVALLGAAVVLPACLLPQEDHIIQPLPPLKNQPPRILESLLQPASRFVTVSNGTGCPNLAFLASVSDRTSPTPSSTTTTWTRTCTRPS
jgi:hypothetical protein